MIFLQINLVMRLVTKAKTCIIDVGTNVLAVLIILVLAEVLTLKLWKWLNYSHPEQKGFKNYFADKFCICQWKEI